MEKEDAEKATTELEGSVTSKEDNSLADNSENNGMDDAKKANSATAEEPAATDEVNEATPQPESVEESAIDGEIITPEELPVNIEVNKSDTNEDKQDDSEELKASEEKPLESVESAKPDKVSDKPELTESEAKDESQGDQDKTVSKDKTEISGETPQLNEEPNLTGELAESSTTDSNKKADESDIVEEKPEGSSKPENAESKIVENQHDADEHHDEYQNADFTTYSKEDLVEVIKVLGKDENPFLADRILKQIAPIFNKIRGQEREDALNKFIKEGGAKDDFQYKPDELSLRFDANYKLIKDKKTKKFKEQEGQRNKNLVIAEEVLSELREFVDSEESSNSFNAFKAIQQKWKDIGDVPSQSSRTLWANYNALIHRFYDQRSIYFELKELDRKKNYEYKLKLCDKAEGLVDEENLREAIKGLNDLHHEFKHLGPVPQELQEDLWQRFKAASDKVYERRKAFVHELKAELHENLGKKQELIEEIKLFTEFQSDRIKEWNEKTKELIVLQKSWETIGGLPKEKAKHINKEFWSSFKKFFSNKHQFFKKLDAAREEHLIKKQELLEQATALKDSEEWEKTANELKRLQSQWREIGPVPEKMRKKLYEEFKACCDHFFDKRRVGQKNSLEDYNVNLQSKKKIIAEILELKKDADKNLDRFNELRSKFLEMGYVPKKNIISIKEEYQSAIEAFLSDLTVLNVKQKTEISLEAEFANLAGSDHSESELYHKEQSVRRQINKLEDDIALWQNNLEFFAHSKSTDKLRKEVNKKIDDASVHVDSLKRQLKMLRTL